MLGIGILVIAYGLWNMQPWAWKWAIGLLILGLVIDVIFFIVEGQLKPFALRAGAPCRPEGARAQGAPAPPSWLSALLGLIVLVYLAVSSTRKIYLT